MAKGSYKFFSPQFMEREKAPGWYTTVGITGLAVALFFVFFLHRYLAAVVTILGVAVLFKYANVKPRKREVEISSKGIKISTIFYPYEKLAGFWFIATNDGIILYLKTKKRFFSNLALPIENKDPNELRVIIASHLPELPSQDEDMVDRVGRLLKF